MTEQCFMCGYNQEALDDIPLCHWCYDAFAHPASPFYAPYLVQARHWEVAMSDPHAKMWVQKRLENK